MMLFKLAFRNIAKSFHDYMIYFATLVLGVAVFYVFNALDSQTVMLIIAGDTREIVDVIIQAMSVVSVFVSFILGFLIVYASSFLMKRLKKEFGLYLVLGMGKGKVSAILLIETLYVGFVSLVAGLLVGIPASQGMSILVANLFKADMTDFRFTVSCSAIAKTLLYFAVIFIVVIIFQTLIVGKNRLINLLNANKKSQKNYGKNPVICVMVFAIGAVLLGTAYYNVTAGFNGISSLKEIGTEIVKGIIGNFAVFWGLSGLFIIIAKSNRKFYYKGLNCFTTKELSSRINTSVFAGGIISLLLFFTISILSCSVSVKNSMDIVLEKKTPMDVQFSMDIVLFDEDEYSSQAGLLEIMEESGVDMSNFKDMITAKLYYGNDITVESVTMGNAKDVFVAPEEMWVPIIKISDYNKLAKAFNMKTLQVDSGEYMIVADNDQVVELYSQSLKANYEISLNGRTYVPAYSECKDGFVQMSNAENNNGVIIVADDVDLSFMNFACDYCVANYNTRDEGEKSKIDEYLQSDEFLRTINPGDGSHAYISAETKTSLINGVVGFSVLLVFVGLYIGIIFLISSGAILSLKELSEAADSKDKYTVLRKIGVDEKQIRRSVLTQSGIFFGMPLLLAIVHSVFGIQTALLILEVFGRAGLFLSIITSAAIILGIYGVYFWITYSCSKKIVSEQY